MGLAASQARFLGITARKNHCELKSMQIAQEKLSVTNQLSQISQDYQKSLDATMLVWDSELITDGSVYDVSYQLLMQPSDLNDYSPQLLTNHRNQVVLNNQMAAAAREAGLAETGGSPRNENDFLIFINKLNAKGVISSKDATEITKAKELYRNDNGLGGYVMETFDTKEMNLSQMKKFINAITDPSSSYMTDLAEKYKAPATSTPDTTTSTPYTKAQELADILSFKMGNNIKNTKSSTTNPSLGTWIANSSGWENTDTGTGVTALTGEISLSSDFNLADLLSRDIIFTVKGDATARDTSTSIVLCNFMNLMYNVMNKFFAIDPNSVDQNYLTFAMTQACSLVGLKWNAEELSAENDNFPKYINTSDSASSHTGIVHSGDIMSVSLSNIAKNILTYFEVAVEGFNSGYNVQSTEQQLLSSSYYVTKDPDYIYFVDNPAAADHETEGVLLLNFYSQMFNQICTNGWTENAAIEDPATLKNMLKNGSLFTATLSDDGMFYQGPYTSNNFIAEVADEDAIAKAEADFRIKQAKLNALEERLNVDMQMVDAELSALTTEYDTVKQLISKGIEKGFSTLGGG